MEDKRTDTNKMTITTMKTAVLLKYSLVLNNDKSVEYRMVDTNHIGYRSRQHRVVCGRYGDDHQAFKTVSFN